MKNIKTPEGYPRVMPYLIVENANGFLDFTQKVFEADVKFKEMRDEKLIMHAEVAIGDSVIMFADATEQYKPQLAGLFIYVDDCDAVFQKALENGVTVINQPADQSYGRTGGIRDPFGITWWITSV